jgi:hypothetical protein
LLGASPSSRGRRTTADGASGLPDGPEDGPTAVAELDRVADELVAATDKLVEGAAIAGGEESLPPLPVDPP